MIEFYEHDFKPGDKVRHKDWSREGKFDFALLVTDVTEDMLAFKSYPSMYPAVDWRKADEQASVYLRRSADT